MIHLFDKLYITYAESSVGPDSADRTCEDYFQIIDKDLYDINNVHYGKYRYGFAKSINQLVENYSNFEGFLRFIQGQLSVKDVQRIIIYADDKAMNEFLIRWWKGIFPNMTEEGLISLYQIYADSELLQMSNKDNFVNIAVDSTEISFSDLADDYWKSSVEEIRGLVNCYEGFEIPRDIVSKSSLEFRIIDFILSDKSEHLPSLLRDFENLYKKSFMHDVCGCKRNIERNILLITKQFPTLNHLGNSTFKSIQEIVRNSDELSFLLDHNIKESKESFDYIKSEYNLLELCQKLVKYDLLIHQHRGFHNEELLNYLDNPFLISFIKNEKHPDLLDLLKNELTTGGTHLLFKGLIRKNRMNPYLVPAFYNLYQSDNKHKLLQEFKLSSI